MENLTYLFPELEDIDKIEYDEFEYIAQQHMRTAELACNVTTNDLQSYNNESGAYCPRTFDGWSCWNETPAGNTAYSACPWFIPGFDPERRAHKTCLEDGTWFRHPESNVTWSNYTTCVDLAALSRYKTVVTIYEVGYLISLCALFLSLIIFCSFRCLECTRVRIHKQLFVSFILNNVLWLIWYRSVMNESVPVNQLNQFFCGILHVLVRYFLVANYFWMFCEGFYLHTLIVYSFTRLEGNLLKGFYVFGWLGPLVPVTFYTVFRAKDHDSHEQQDCWIHESQWSLFLSVPVCLCLVISLAFLINILRVLLIKLNANRRTLSMSMRRESTVAENTASLRKGEYELDDRDFIILSPNALAPCVSWTGQGHCHFSRVRGYWVTVVQAARATLILIPLLGLHYFIIPFRPDPYSDWAIYYEYIAAISSSLQGLAVSLLFCFCNGEVIAVLRRKFSRHYCPGKLRTEYSYARTTMTTMVVRRPSEDDHGNGGAEARV